jgi:two-component system OmpR family sensor kinase
MLRLRHLWPPGIRMQLTIWYTLVFALLLLCSDILLYTQLQTSLLNNLDKALSLQAKQIATNINSDGGIVTIQDIGGQPEGTGNTPSSNNQQGSHIDIMFSTLVRVLDLHGHVVSATPSFHMLLVPAISMTETLRQHEWLGTVQTRAGQQVRLYSTIVTENGTSIAIVQVGESLAQLETSLRSLLLELLLIAPFALLLGGTGSYWLAARAFIPIDQLTRKARQIGAGDLHQRVPVPSAHDEVRRLAQTLNEMIERLDQSFARQLRFVADASHELRTPVAVIRSMTDLALLQELSSTEYKTLLENINNETERLGRLISDLLVLARADEGNVVFEREPVRLDELVHAVAQNAELLAVEHDLKLEVYAAQPVTILGDESRLIQAVMNLLDNAIQYTNAGGKVTVIARQNGAAAQVVVQDTGIGIAPEHLPHIFERFYRVDPARLRTENNNSGLGLSLVKWIIEMHGGSITVESQPGQGSTFTVTLPQAMPHTSLGRIATPPQ